MKLIYSTASPYARKVVVAAREAGIIDQINIISTNANPVDPNQDIVASNPIGKIPTLILDDGTAFFDSRVICEYIDAISNGTKLYPSDPIDRARIQTIHAMGDGMLDAALLTRYETFLRPKEFLWDEWAKGQQTKIHNAIDYLEKNTGALEGDVNIGNICIACALSYIEYREIIEDWREGHPKLEKWYNSYAERESMKATVPSG